MTLEYVRLLNPPVRALLSYRCNTIPEFVRYPTTQFYQTNLICQVTCGPLHPPFHPLTSYKWRGAGQEHPRAKAASSRNALKHGLSAGDPVVRQVEDAEDWQRHLEQVISSIEPEGYLETELAVRAAGLLWRHASCSPVRGRQDQPLPRPDARRLQRGPPLWRGGDRPAIEESFTLEKIQMQTGIRMLSDGDTLQKITRYESHLHRQLMHQTLHELEAMQARRRGEHSPPVRLDISGPPGG